MARMNMSLEFKYRWFATYKGIDIYMATAPRVIEGVFYMSLGGNVTHSESFDDLRNEVNAWWKLRRN
jgi:hypothetical protein